MCCNVVLKKKKKPRLQTATLIISMSLQLQRYFEKSMISRKVSLICTYVLISPSYKCCSVLREICRESNWILCMCPLSVAGRLCGEVRWVRRESPRSEWLQQGEPTHRGLKPLPSDATEQPGRCDRSEGRYFCQMGTATDMWRHLLRGTGSSSVMRKHTHLFLSFICLWTGVQAKT